MDDTPTEPTRRRFTTAAAASLAALPLAGGAFLALRTAVTPARREAPRRLPLCRLSRVPDEGLLAVPVSYEVRRGPAVESIAKTVFVGRDAGGDVYALLGDCTHLGCPLRHDPARADDPLVCLCHGGSFSAAGEPRREPVTVPLRRLAIEVPDSPDEHIVLLEV